MSAGRRGFTLIEVALAAVLGSMVVLVAVSVFSSLETADRVGQEAFDDSLSEALAHEAITKAVGGLAMSNSTPPPRNAEGNRMGRDRSEERPEPPTDDDREPERPRLLLELDDALPPVMPDTESNNAGLMHPQRLEVALRTRPLFVFGVERGMSVEELADFGYPVDGDRADVAVTTTDDPATDGPAARDPANPGDDTRPAVGAADTGDDLRSNRNRRRSLSARRGPAGGPDNADLDRSNGEPRDGSSPRSESDDRVTTELVQGVRGAFEFKFDPGVEAGGREQHPGWVLWWRQIYPVVDAPFDLEPTSGQRVGQTRLMGNIASATWRALYTKKSGANQGNDAERLREHSAVWSDDLPGYIELEIHTNSGIRHEWTFEIGWGLSGEPGSIASVTGQPAVAANLGAGLGAGGSVTDRSRTPTGETGRDSNSTPDDGRRRSNGRPRSGMPSNVNQGSMPNKPPERPRPPPQ